MTALAAFETSTAAGSVALLQGGSAMEVELARDRAHASDLLPALDGLLRSAGLSLPELDALVVGLGPGSFTGLRVAAATALGLARGAALALVGVPSFEATALAALAPGEEGAVVADARSGALYFARYLRLADDLATLEPPQALAPSELASRIAGDFPIVGDSALLRGALLPPAAVARLRGAAPRAAALARLGAARLAQRGPSAPEEIEPLYLRPFAVRARG